MSGSAAGAFAAVAKGIVEVAANDLERGSESENDGGEHGYSEGKGQHGKIEADDGFFRNDALRHQGHDGFESAPSEERAKDGAAGREQEAFDQELADDAPASGAECGADGELFLASGGAGEEQVGDVAATD